MECPYFDICGGCPMRQISDEEYRFTKEKRFAKIVQMIRQSDIKIGEAVFVADGQRRRAELTFKYHKGKLSFGFNAAQSHEIADIEKCLALTPMINDILPAVRKFLQQFCTISVSQRDKKKIITTTISEGEIWLTEAANGMDILLEVNQTPDLQHRMLISEFVTNNANIIRVSVAKKGATPETIVEKTKPFIEIAGKQVFIPAGTFLQPSKAGERALVNLVLKYLGDTTGNIADLFCGVGTFSYPLAVNMQNKIMAVDSSTELLNGFRKTVNTLMLPNIEIVQRNLFKYPLDESELSKFATVVIDPPRAGAAAQMKRLAEMNTKEKPAKIIAISCNPHTFVNDANILISGGYEIKEMTMVDQFVFAEHFELVALFMKKKGEENEFE